MTDAECDLAVCIAAKTVIARDIHHFELHPVSRADLPPFQPGAHVGIRTPSGALRRYSLCGDPAERDRYCIAVKREETGRGGSASMADDTRVGDVLAITPPRNDFALKGNPARYIFIAGGIGITPIRAMILHLMREGGKPFRLYYLARNADMMAFREEFEAPQFRGKVVLHHDDGDPAQAFDLWPILEEPKGAHLYCCGPRGLMQAVRDMTGHWSSAAVHFEDFGTATMPIEDNRPFRIRLARRGASLDVPQDKSILETLRASGIPVPSSCESGTCGTCRTGLLSGEADHRDLALSDQERARSIMICVSRARGGELVLDL